MFSSHCRLSILRSRLSPQQKVVWKSSAAVCAPEISASSSSSPDSFTSTSISAFIRRRNHQLVDSMATSTAVAVLPQTQISMRFSSSPSNNSNKTTDNEKKKNDTEKVDYVKKQGEQQAETVATTTEKVKRVDEPEQIKGASKEKSNDSSVAASTTTPPQTDTASSTSPPPPSDSSATKRQQQEERVQNRDVESTSASTDSDEATTTATTSAPTNEIAAAKNAEEAKQYKKMMAGSSKTDEELQVEQQKKEQQQQEDLSKKPPKGFEFFFLPPFERPPPSTEDYKTPAEVSPAEAQQIRNSDKHQNDARLSKRVSQFLFFCMFAYIFHKFWYRNSGAHQLGGETLYYYDRRAAEREEEAKLLKPTKKTKKQTAVTGAGEATGASASAAAASTNAAAGVVSSNTAANDEGEGDDEPASTGAISVAGDFDTRTIKYITVAPDIHAAVYYSEDGKRLFTQKFIDFGTWLRDIEKRATEDGPFVRMDVTIGFPIVAIAFLWLMPFLGRFYRSVNFGLGHARKEAQIAIQKQQNISELETPSKGRFRFKKELDVKTRLEDVAGLTEAKYEVNEIIDFLKAPEKYTHLGAKLPKGVLIDGPPGVGKTLLARAVAGEAGLSFVSCSGSEFDEVYVGVGAMRVRELFKAARENAPCVVFIDEIDTFGKKRRRDAKGTSRGTINALLSELDGFKESSRIMVLAATNRADILDDALTRSGRFDRKISVDLPPHKDRVAIAHVHLKPLKLHPSLLVDKVAEAVASLTPGCSGADLYNICNEAAIVASRLDKEFVDMECFHRAMDRIMIGLERKARKYERHEKERLAIHEAGHVVLSWFLKTTDPVMKATIAPRGGTTEGISRKLPHEKFISTQEALHEKMIQRLGGYVAEEHFFTNISANAADDLAKVTQEAKGEICVYGMAPQTVGHFGYPMNEEDVLTKPYGIDKENVIDKEIANLVAKISDSARDMLKKYQTEVRAVAGILLKQETVTAKELWVLLGERPVMSPEFRKYLESEAH